MLAARVLYLEESMKEMRGDMKDVRDRLAKIEGKIGMLPGWPGLLTIAGLIIAGVGILIRYLPQAY